MWSVRTHSYLIQRKLIQCKLTQSKLTKSKLTQGKLTHRKLVMWCRECLRALFEPEVVQLAQKFAKTRMFKRAI